MAAGGDPIALDREQVLEAGVVGKLNEVRVGTRSKPRPLVEGDGAAEVLDGRRGVAGQGVVGGDQVPGLGGVGGGGQVALQVGLCLVGSAVHQQDGAEVELDVGGFGVERLRPAQGPEGTVEPAVRDVESGAIEPCLSQPGVLDQGLLEIAPTGLDLAEHEECRAAQQKLARDERSLTRLEAIEQLERLLGLAGLEQRLDLVEGLESPLARAGVGGPAITTNSRAASAARAIERASIAGGF